jgi:hypothetical protein
MHRPEFPFAQKTLPTIVKSRKRKIRDTFRQQSSLLSQQSSRRSASFMRLNACIRTFTIHGDAKIGQLTKLLVIEQMYRQFRVGNIFINTIVHILSVNSTNDR